MEVRFVYDASAIYVAARMYSRNPSDIQAPMGRRDSGTSQAEHIFVSLDTFLDRRTAYTFGVTASGVRLDHFHRSDDENDTDSGFDPVWQARTSLDDEGWTAELWIPFTQAAVQRSAGAGLGAERAAVHADARRGRLLGARAADGTGVGVPLWRFARHPGCAAPAGVWSCCPTSPARRR